MATIITFRAIIIIPIDKKHTCKYTFIALRAKITPKKKAICKNKVSQMA
jgi:hypothetical protein